MAIEGFGGVNGPVGSFNGKITLSVVITCIVAASSGLLFGYYIGISGMDQVLTSFLLHCVLLVWPYLAWIWGWFHQSGNFCIPVGSGTTKMARSFQHRLRILLRHRGVPASIMTIGALFISDTRSSQIQRGKVELARKSLRKIRWKDCDVEPELVELEKASEVAKEANQEPFVTIFERQYRPHLVMSIDIPFFQQLSGINIIAFCAPVLFQSVGFGNDSALIAAINLTSIAISAGVVDRFGRRFLFMEGGIQMFVCHVGVAVVLAGSEQISKGYAILVLVLMCIYAAGFGWSRVLSLGSFQVKYSPSKFDPRVKASASLSTSRITLPL
ncbi:Sugar transport protein 5 [Hibiscus syriacus]|uniref:Sugar transport protein 5 n=1 Tax=Hibiscus syriacus TaxID=106335 RepID=A0A6A2XLN3_HIBSY|nr:Sugar transport protein 5 [Hibiscus syriacus]